MPPAAWGSVIMTMLYKKGNKADPGNYRGIALINTLAKLFTSILKSRLESWAIKLKNIPDCQAGFMKGKNCSDNIYVLMSAINQQLRLKNRKVYPFFIDFKRAFDSVNHNKLLMFLYQIGVSARFLRLLQNFYGLANLRVRQGVEYSVRIEITEGVLQGRS